MADYLGHLYKIHDNLSKRQIVYYLLDDVRDVFIFCGLKVEREPLKSGRIRK